MHLIKTLQETVEFKKLLRPLKIILVDDTRKMVVIDDSAPVSGIVQVIGEKLGIKSWGPHLFQPSPPSLIPHPH